MLQAYDCQAVHAAALGQQHMKWCLTTSCKASYQLRLTEHATRRVAGSGHLALCTFFSCLCTNLGVNLLAQRLLKGHQLTFGILVIQHHLITADRPPFSFSALSGVSVAQ